MFRDADNGKKTVVVVGVVYVLCIITRLAYVIYARVRSAEFRIGYRNQKHVYQTNKITVVILVFLP